ncbi:MAG: ABC transporter substrate-binding protein [Planctomycetes bacterium]|nr:ABC transporter substrate-binding protein [Planctomycetota bacterium]
MAAQRIVSLVPSATQILFHLGLGARVVGTTHECKLPPGAATPRVVVSNTTPLEGRSSAEIDRLVTEQLEAGQGLYRLDEAAVRELAPDLVVTQDLCTVCATPYAEVRRAMERLPKAPALLSLDPQGLEDVLGDVERVGAAAGAEDAARAAVAALRRRIDDVLTRARPLRTRPRVACLEWLEPLWAAGHWIPEMVDIAGGEDLFGRARAPSARLPWEAFVAGAPEAVFLLPCGFGLERTAREAAGLCEREGWKELPAVQRDQVFALDGDSYFSAPGPSLVDGLEILHALLHPEAPGALPPPPGTWERPWPLR